MAAITILIELEAPDQMLGKDLREHISGSLAKLHRKHITVVDLQLYRTKALRKYLSRLG